VTGQVWDRTTDSQGKLEPALWYRRFEAFRLAGPGRSMLAVYNHQRREKARSSATEYQPARTVPSSWRQNATLWRWVERAEAWDVHAAQRARIEREAEEARLRAQVRKTRRNLLGVGHNLLAKTALTYLGPHGATPDARTLLQLMTAIEKFNRDSRLEYGPPPAPTQTGVNIAVSAEDGKASAVISVIEVERPASSGCPAADSPHD
jgi:hypothetical protein